MPDPQPAYTAAARAVDRVLRRNGSLFVPGRLWSPALAGALSRRLSVPPGAAGDPFRERWHDALDNAGDDVVLAAAELLYVHLLFASDLRTATKRSLVERTLALRASPLHVPADLDAALERGIAPTGVAYKRLRLSQLALLADAVTAWKALPARHRSGLLDDAWAFKAWLEGVGGAAGSAQRQALAHLVHPDAFEPIVSLEVKRRIVAAFAGDVPAGVDDVDQALHALRRTLAARHGDGFSFFDDAVAVAWR